MASHEINHETADLSQYTLTVSGGSNVISVIAPGLVSGYKLQCEINDQNSVYGQLDFTQFSSGVYRGRVYFNLDALSMAHNDVLEICRIMTGTAWRLAVRIRYLTSGYEIRLKVADDGGLSNTAYHGVSTGQHFAEFRVQYATSASANDGSAELWLDDVSQEVLSNLDLYNTSQPDNFRLGAEQLSAVFSGDLHLDEIILNDSGDYIGPVEIPTTTAPPVGFGRQKARLDLFESLTFGLAQYDVALSPMTRWIAYFGLDYLNQRWMWTYEGQPVSDAQWAEIEQHIDTAFTEILTDI